MLDLQEGLPNFNLANSPLLAFYKAIISIHNGDVFTKPYNIMLPSFVLV
jgi:hypothetical protein